MYDNFSKIKNIVWFSQQCHLGKKIKIYGKFGKTLMPEEKYQFHQRPSCWKYKETFKS